MNLHITDEGWIRNEDLDRVFEPFYTGANGHQTNETMGYKQQ